MATGHTHRIIDGEINTLDEFAYECSKSFVWSWRDGNGLAYPPRHDSYYAERLPQAIAELAEWDNASEEERYAKWSAYANKQEQQAEEARKRADLAYLRLAPLLDAAKAKVVPETHKNFKEFMISQLEDTIKHDGVFNSNWYRVYSYPEWADSQRGEILRTIERCSEGLREAEENNRKSREWISTLAALFNLEVKDADERG